MATKLIRPPPKELAGWNNPIAESLSVSPKCPLNFLVCFLSNLLSGSVSILEKTGDQFTVGVMYIFERSEHTLGPLPFGIFTPASLELAFAISFLPVSEESPLG